MDKLTSLGNFLRRWKRTWQNANYAAYRVIVPEPTVVMDNQLLAGKIVLITGAGQNIGRAIALEMAKQGATILFTDVHPDRLAEVTELLRPFSDRSQGFLSDVSEEKEIDRLCQILDNAGTFPHILINNVGIHVGHQTPFTALSLNLFQHSFQTNLFGPLYLTQQITQRMITHHLAGSLLFISSIHQWTPHSLISYSSTKAALGMAIKELALELAPHHIRVNGIAPGWVGENSQGEPFFHTYGVLYRSAIKPCYIGRAAVYLSADYFSQFTTGTILKIDGGLSLVNHTTYSSQK